MKRLLSFIVLLITLIGCSNNSTSTSEDKYYSDNDLSNILSVLNSKSENIDKIYQLVRHNTPGKFIRSYKTLEQAKSAAMVRNEWCGWGNVERKMYIRLIMIK